MHNVNLHFWKEKIQPQTFICPLESWRARKKSNEPLNFREKKKTTSAKSGKKKKTKKTPWNKNPRVLLKNHPKAANPPQVKKHKNGVRNKTRSAVKRLRKRGPCASIFT